MTDRAPTEREPRTEAGRAMRLWLLRLRQQHGVTWPKLNVAAEYVARIEEEAAASPPATETERWSDLPRCSYCNEKGTHAPQCDRPATETGGLDPDARLVIEAVAAIAAGADDLNRGMADGLATAGGTLSWEVLDAAARLRSPSVGEGFGEGET